VLLPVYNADAWVGEAIRSILAQSFADFELIIIDDGSTDRSANVIREFGDDRIRFVSRENRGIAATLNEALEVSRGELIARQDADDISERDRFRLQVEYLDRHPDVTLLGTNYVMIAEDGHSVGRTNLFTHPDDVKVALVVANQFCQGSVIFRRTIVAREGGYDAKVVVAEDYELFTRIAHSSRVANLPMPLYRWRVNPGGMSSTRRDAMDHQARLIQEREASRFLSHRAEYKVFRSFHPFSLLSGPLTYLDRKGALYRNLGFMYAVRGFRRQGLTALVMAALCEPWRKRNYRAIRRVAHGAPGTSLAELESIRPAARRRFRVR
jgi:glycosyltransferase involved in cell wall biosynthesis